MDGDARPPTLGDLAGAASGAPDGAARRILRAEILSVGSELTSGETRDTNAGELAFELARLGVDVGRLVAVPDRLDVVADAFRAAAGRADLVLSTGGLGPTPDDLTREAIAAAIGERPAVDPVLEAWLRELWRRRGIRFPDINLKQAWLVPSGRAIPNGNGTAPGWWVERADGGLIVALPGPPREMRPMWAESVRPWLLARGLGRHSVVRTYRLMGIGESALADLLGEEVLRGTNPVVATYARADGVDMRISAAGDGRAADDAVADAEGRLLPLVEPYVWGRDGDTWPLVLDRALAARGWSLATLEVDTHGSLAALLAGSARLRSATSLAELAPDAGRRRGPAALVALAALARERAAADVGLALVVRPRGADTQVLLGLSTPAGDEARREVAFLGGSQGRARAALLAAAFLLRRLRADRVGSQAS